MGFIDLLFAELEKPEFWHKSNLQANLIGKSLLYDKKLEALSKEFDTGIAARLANLILKQVDVRRQQRKLYRQVKGNDVAGVSNVLERELKWNQDKVHIDDIQLPAKSQVEGVSRARITAIAEMTTNYLERMDVRPDEMFKDLAHYHTDKRDATNEE